MTAEYLLSGHGWTSQELALATLAAPLGKSLPAIDVAWNTATGDSAYLDNIPDDVAHFESVVSSLPGLGHKGVVTRLVIDENFRMEHATALLVAMLDLKNASEQPAW